MPRRGGRGCGSAKDSGDVGHAIKDLAEAGYRVIQISSPHGVGRKMHEDPQIPNYGRPGTTPPQPGMTFAMITWATTTSA